MENLVLQTIVAFIMLSFLSLCLCQRDQSFYCEVCNVVVDELEWEISKVDPKKVIEVESFRVDPIGRQSYSKKIPFARSETHLTELLEKICENMNQFAESTDPATGKKSYVRTSSRNGEPVTLSNASISGEVAEKLKYACENVVGEHDEEIIEVFKKEDKNSQQKLCRDVLGFCSNGADHEEL